MLSGYLEKDLNVLLLSGVSVSATSAGGTRLQMALYRPKSIERSSVDTFTVNLSMIDDPRSNAVNLY